MKADKHLENKMKKLTSAFVFAATALAASSVLAQESPWMIRIHAVDIDTADKSTPVAGTGPSDQITVSNKVIPEFDVSYFFTPHWSTELMLSYPQTHDVYLSGAKIGSVKELPPTLTALYHFVPGQTISPYLGAGVNYTHFSDVNLGNGTLRLDNNSVGYTLQGGIDFQLNPHWSLNVDVKYVEMRSNVYAGGSAISNLQINPWLFGLGVGYRF